MMKTTQGKNHHRGQANEQGSILVLSLMVSLILLGLGLTAMYLSSEGGTVATNIGRRGEAYLAAQSALEHARSILLSATDWSEALDGCTGSGSWTTDMVDEDSTTGEGRGRVLCNSADVPLWEIKMFPSGTSSKGKVGTLKDVEYTVWIRNDDDEGGANGVFTDANTRVIVRAEARARGNLGFVALEQIIGRGAGSSLTEAAYSQAGMGPTGSNSGTVALSN